MIGQCLICVPSMDTETAVSTTAYCHVVLSYIPSTDFTLSLQLIWFLPRGHFSIRVVIIGPSIRCFMFCPYWRHLLKYHTEQQWYSWYCIVDYFQREFISNVLFNIGSLKINSIKNFCHIMSSQCSSKPLYMKLNSSKNFWWLLAI